MLSAVFEPPKVTVLRAVELPELITIVPLLLKVNAPVPLFKIPPPVREFCKLNSRFVVSPAPVYSRVAVGPVLTVANTRFAATLDEAPIPLVLFPLAR